MSTKKLPTLPDDILKHIFSKAPDIYKMPIAKKFYPSQKELPKMVIAELKKLQNFNYISKKFPTKSFLYYLTKDVLIQFIIGLSDNLTINILEDIEQYTAGIFLEDVIGKHFNSINDLTEKDIVTILLDIGSYEEHETSYLIDIVNSIIISKYEKEEMFVIDKLVDFGLITKKKVYELIENKLLKRPRFHKTKVLYIEAPLLIQDIGIDIQDLETIIRYKSRMKAIEILNDLIN